MEKNNKENKNKNQSTADKLARAVSSRPFKIILVCILGLIILLAIFGVGLMAGYRKANFSFRWGENYHRMFGGPRGGFMQPGPMLPMMDFGDDYISGHGTVGTIIKIDSNNIIIKGNDNVEKTILVNDKTAIRQGRQDIKVGDLKTGSLIVAIGDPNNSGQIEAKLIRIFNSQ